MRARDARVGDIVRAPDGRTYNVVVASYDYLRIVERDDPLPHSVIYPMHDREMGGYDIVTRECAMCCERIDDDDLAEVVTSSGDRYVVHASTCITRDMEIA